VLIPVTPGAEPPVDPLPELYRYPAGRSWLRANVIATVDGAAQGPDGRSGSISGAPDRRLLALLRALSDVILVGANTTRTEKYAPADIRPEFAPLRVQLGLSPTPSIAVVSASLDIPEPLLDDPRTLVLTCATSSPVLRAHLARRVNVVVAGRDRVDVRAAVAALVQRGHRRLLCEGGPHLLSQLVAAGLIDELCVTVSPLLAAGSSLRAVSGADLSQPSRLVLASLVEDEGFLFFRWLTGSSSSAG
jgi:riboflavin biosynthesis pyrimidine reductase